jgi:hypothetical protein
MPATTHNSVLHLAPSGEFHLCSDGNDRTLTDAESFVLGYSLVLAGKNADAAQVFKALAARNPTRNEFAIMLARCDIGLADYDECNNLLRSLFGDGDQESVDNLQSALVFDFLGMWNDAALDFQKVARRHAEIPLLHLLLGDCCLRKHRPDWALRCWMTAISLDTKPGGVGMLARRRTALLRLRQAKALTKKTPPP